MPDPTARRSDATRNRERILASARAILADPASEVSMAQVARGAGVGMATLYRNFAGLPDLLEALYAEEVDALVDAAGASDASPADALQEWLRRFALFHETKHPIATQLLRHTDRTDPVFSSSRDRVVAAGRPLLAAAQAAAQIRDDVTIEQVLDLVLAVIAIPGDSGYRAPIVQSALDGLRRGTSR